MKKILALALILTTLLSASENKNNKQSRIDKQLKIEMEKEKKYAKEQTFYTQDNYDFKGSEVNPDSLDSVPLLEPQYDFEMDSVYD
ncbi:MAG: hypothetical protein U9R50_04735 [Campylobacterota bacterium]|nr:hypothetical protein [Campylobacterota bacterium]